MTQTVFVAHWLGGAILIQSLMELYAYQKKKARQVRQHQNELSGKTIS